MAGIRAALARYIAALLGDARRVLSPSVEIPSPRIGRYLDIGHNVVIAHILKDGATVGLVDMHRDADGRLCRIVVMFDPGGPLVALEGRRRLWTVQTWDPLTLTEPIRCHCGHAGRIRDDRWVPA